MLPTKIIPFLFVDCFHPNICAINNHNTNMIWWSWHAETITLCLNLYCIWLNIDILITLNALSTSIFILLMHQISSAEIPLKLNSSNTSCEQLRHLQLLEWNRNHGRFPMERTLSILATGFSNINFLRSKLLVSVFFDLTLPFFIIFFCLTQGWKNR